MISRLSRFISSGVFSYAHFYFNPDREAIDLFRYLATSYLVTGVIYEKYGLVASTVSHIMYNMIVEVILKGAVRGVCFEMMKLVPGVDIKTVIEVLKLSPLRKNWKGLPLQPLPLLMSAENVVTSPAYRFDPVPRFHPDPAFQSVGESSSRHLRQPT